MKEKLTDALGSVGIVLFYIISVLIVCAPLGFLDFPFWLDVLIIIGFQLLPGIGSIAELVLWVWSFFIVIKGPIDVLAILYFVAMGIYFFSFLPPIIVSIIAKIRGG